MDVKLNLDEAGLKNIMSEALLRSIDEKARDGLVREAITFLVTKEMRGGSYGASPLQRAFNEALQEVASKIAHDMIVNDVRVHAEIQKMVLEAWDRATGEGREKMVQNLASHLSNALTGEQY